MNGLRLFAVIACFCVAACGGKAPVAAVPTSGVTLLGALPQPTGVDTQDASRQTFVGPFTELTIEVYGVAELRRDVLTDGNGRFSYPFAGTVDGAGKTTAELGREIEGRLSGRYVRNPQVTVNLKASSNPALLLSQAVTIDGEVTKPGQYPLVGKQTLMRAISLAGGIGKYAKLDDVLVFRKVEGKQYVGIYNLKAIRRGNYADPEVFPNDVIVVGDSPQRRLFEDVISAATLLSTPLVIFSNLSGNNN